MLRQVTVSVKIWIGQEGVLKKNALESSYILFWGTYLSLNWAESTLNIYCPSSLTGLFFKQAAPTMNKQFETSAISTGASTTLMHRFPHK